MKVAIVFYSFSGNTRRCCEFIRTSLQGAAQVELLELKPKKEEEKFLKQCAQAFMKRKVPLCDTEYNLATFDAIIFASPVWAFTFAPALHYYFEKVEGLQGKRVGCFLTYGSGAGSNKALKELIATVKAKGGEVVFSKNLQDYKTKDEKYLEENLASLRQVVS